MSQLAQILFKRLERQHLESYEINRLIRDVSNTINRQNSFKTHNIKQSLASLGWEKNILDNRTLELLFIFIENEGGVNNHEFAS
ncbi:hypothetical protein QUF75_05805 [Desulfococcaceae bacterium HSG7]|nr:hypothetical protein [Desulfococcaceae bacterium HSG9]MDM8554227.1 hypothetical protein [Desulfococcaceae bacterium HSG7]